MEKNWWKEAVAYQVYPRSFNDSNNDNQSHNYALTIVTFAVFEASEILAVSPDHSVI